MLLLNKTDLVSPAELDQLEARIRSMNRTCKILRTRNAETDLAHLLNVRAFDLDAKLEFNEHFLAEEVPFEWGGVFALEKGDYQVALDAGPDPAINVLFLPISPNNDETYEAAKNEAIITFADDGTVLESGALLHPDRHLATLLLGKDGATYTLKVADTGHYALFTQHGPEEFNLRLLRDGVAAEPVRAQPFAHSHTHDQSVTSVGIVNDAPLADILGAVDKHAAAVFRTAYERTMAACYACQVTCEKPFLRLHIPEQPEARMIDFTPVEAPAK